MYYYEKGKFEKTDDTDKKTDDTDQTIGVNNSLVRSANVNSNENSTVSAASLIKSGSSDTFKFNPAMEQRILAAKDRQNMRQQARARRLSGGSERIESQYLKQPDTQKTYTNRRGEEKKSKLYKHNRNVQERINKGLPLESKTGVKKLKRVSTGGFGATQSNINNTSSLSLSNISGANTLPKTESDYADPNAKNKWGEVGLSNMVKERESLNSSDSDYKVNLENINKLITETRKKHKLTAEDLAKK